MYANDAWIHQLILDDIFYSVINKSAAFGLDLLPGDKLSDLKQADEIAIAEDSVWEVGSCPVFEASLIDAQVEVVNRVATYKRAIQQQIPNLDRESHSRSTRWPLVLIEMSDSDRGLASRSSYFCHHKPLFPLHPYMYYLPRW